MCEEAKKINEEYDAVINVGGGFAMGNIADFDVIEKYEEMYKMNVVSSLLTSHVASKLLAPCGILLFTGALKAFEESDPAMFSYLLSKI